MKRESGKMENTQPIEDSEKDLHFRYNRRERLDLAEGNSGKVDNRRWFRKNRGSFILVLDISLVVVIFIIYNVFLKPDLAAEDYQGHRYELRAVEFAEEILVTLRIKALEEFAVGSPGIVESALFSGDSNQPVALLRELLPDERDEVAILRYRLPAEEFIGNEDGGRLLFARIRVLGEKDRTDWDMELRTGIAVE